MFTGIFSPVRLFTWSDICFDIIITLTYNINFINYYMFIRYLCFNNQLIRDLFNQPEIGRRLNRMWPENLIR
jgi:hypothetical protein